MFDRFFFGSHLLFGSNVHRLTKAFATDRVAFSLYVSKKDISYTFYAEDYNKKMEWFETIEKCLQGLKNVRSRYKTTISYNTTLIVL